MASEAEKVSKQNNMEVLRAFNKIPYALINREITTSASDVLTEFTEIAGYYSIYQQGMKFATEGSSGDYVPATLKYKMSASLINKEARFLFGEAPDIIIEAKGDIGKVSDESKEYLTTYNDLIKTIFEENNFEDNLLKASKDCFIGKRVAALVNFNEIDGVTITFLPSTQFIYETKMGNANVITLFVAFIIVKDSKKLKDKRIFKKKYELIDGVVHLEEVLYDGAGVEQEIVTPFQKTELKKIPVVVMLNDGLSSDTLGVSEIELLKDYEGYYSKLSNSDIDAERKSMHPIRYAIDMESSSTENLSSSAGSFWDLTSDQNLTNAKAAVGMLESNMGYSESLKTSLDRLKTTAYEQVDVPNISIETLQGAMTSGKSLKAIYWSLIVRCKEKMKMWTPKLRELTNIIIEGSFAYPDCIKRYISDPLVPVSFKVIVEQNLPLPEDEVEEKNMDLSEVESKTMSRKSYMKKWRQLTDDEVDEELKQIALETQMMDNSFAAEPTPPDADFVDTVDDAQIDDILSNFMD